MPDQHRPLTENRVYHLFNRAIGEEKLFKVSENYHYFLFKMEQYILPVADIYAYSLMPNHFHLLVRIKPRQELEMIYRQKKERDFDLMNDNMFAFVMQQFSNWMNGYTKAFNKRYRRMGGLFMDYIKRREAVDAADITNLMFYIHKNAVHHGLTKYIGAWEYDSYSLLLNSGNSFLKKKEVIQWFGSLDVFVRFHKRSTL